MLTISKMQTNLNNEDEYMVTLEFISEEIKEQLKIISMLVERNHYITKLFISCVQS